MCSLWFNTSFIPIGSSWVMEKSIIDKACKDKKSFLPGFKLELFFDTLPDKTELVPSSGWTVADQEEYDRSFEEAAADDSD